MQDLARYEKVRLGKIWQDITCQGKIWQDLTRYDKVIFGKIWQDMTR